MASSNRLAMLNLGFRMRNYSCGRLKEGSKTSFSKASRRGNPDNVRPNILAIACVRFPKLISCIMLEHCENLCEVASP